MLVVGWCRADGYRQSENLLEVYCTKILKFFAGCLVIQPNSMVNRWEDYEKEFYGRHPAAKQHTDKIRTWAKGK